MSLRVSCPYCNSRFAIPGVPASGRAACPRCGDAFNLQGRIEEDGRGDVADAAPLPTEAEAHVVPSFNRRVLLPLALVLVLAGSVVLFLRYRGFMERSGPGPELPEATAAKRPLELAGLGFVPPNSNIVFAIQTGPLLRYCERTNQDPRVLLSQAGLPQKILGTLDRAAVPLEQIDHVAAGVHVPDAPDLGQLRLAIALILRSPIENEERFLEQLSANRAQHAGRTWYQVEFGGLPFKLARASATAWVFGWSDEDLLADGALPRTRLPAPLVEIVENRVPPDCTAWIATASEEWANKRSVRKLAEFGYVKAEWLTRIAKGRAIVAGISLAGEPRLHVAVQCRDTQTGESLRNDFREHLTRPERRVGGEGDWASLDTPADPQRGFPGLKSLLDDDR